MTNLVNAGVSTNDAMEVSGHRTRSVFDRYKIAVEEQTREALRRVSVFTKSKLRVPTVAPMDSRR